MEELTITVNIADRPYRLKIKREEEEIIRKAVKEIEHRIKEYSEHFAFNDKQDLMAMVLVALSLPLPRNWKVTFHPEKIWL